MLFRSIKDYFEIDLTGETFRYPFNNVDDHHLDELSHINLLIFKSQYEKMSKIISHLDILLDFLINEYKQGTFAGGLSRNEIEKICNELPHRDTWKNVDFKSIKNSIMSEYALSSRKFSEVIRKIKEHKEFAYKIGILIENKEISKDIYTEIKRTRSDIVSLKDTNYNKLMSQFQLRLKLVLNDNNCAALRAFYEIGFHQMYSEEYENLVQYYLNQDDNISTLVSQILPRKFIPFVEKGMKICCQWHLLEN